MSVVEIIFSPTGGTEKVAQIIAGKLDENIKRIDLSDSKADFTKCNIDVNDEVLIAMPVFASRPPAVAIDRLKQIKGKGAKCSLICVYGNGDYGNTLSEMKDAAEECGFEVTSAIAAIAQHSIISKYASGRPDEQDIKQLSEFASQIQNKTDKISSELYTEFEEIDDESKPEPPLNPPLPKAGDDCLKCGACAESCPLQAISSKDFVANLGKCIFCMRCVSKCPNGSRKVDEDVLLAAASALEEICSIRKENELFI